MEKISLIDKQIESKKYLVKKGQRLDFLMASFDHFPNVTIDVDVEEGGFFNGSYIDFSKGEGKLVLNVHLLGERAKCNWNSSILGSYKSNKVIDSSLSHDAPKTEGKMVNYGISKDESKLVFTGTSHIKKGSKSSLTRQEAKIIVFDKKCQGKATPVLKIDENEVSASHAAVVGKLNDSHMFYLQSRGLSFEDARKLIVMGYFKPTLEKFDDKNLISLIEKRLEEGI